MTRMFSLTVLVGQGACIAIGVPRIETSSDPTPRTTERGIGQGFTIIESPAFGPKAVVGKQPPNLLIAQDGSQCTVSSEKFAQVALGKSMLCVWGGAR